MSRERLSELREQVDHEALSALGGYGVDGKRLILDCREAIALAEDATADRAALRAEVEALRHEVELTNEHEHQILTERNEARAELDRTKEELERVRRNHLRRMAHVAWLRRDYPRSTPISFRRRGQYDRFALACIRAALERKDGA